MPEPYSELPSLPLLRVFEAAARHANFTHAGRELKLSQAAVSQQIRALEADLGVKLFARLHRGVALTAAGEQLFRTVRASLDMIAKTSRALRADDDKSMLRIGSDLPVAQHWLMPRISEFARSHPDITPDIVASDVEADCLHDEVDVALLYGDGDWPGYEVDFLLDEAVFPICSPDYLARRGPISLETLDTHVLLELTGRWDWLSWQQWLAHAGGALGERARVREFNNLPVLTEAVVNSQGIGLGWKHLCDELLNKGAVVQPLQVSVCTERGYYVLLRTPPSAHASLFRDWLKARVTAQLR